MQNVDLAVLKRSVPFLCQKMLKDFVGIIIFWAIHLKSINMERNLRIYKATIFLMLLSINPSCGNIQ